MSQSPSTGTLGRWVMIEFTSEEKRRISKEIDQAFQAIKELIKDPKKLESLPDEAVILPIEV